ncbi:MAG: hypothetical protein IT200_13710 [Thermoleophilia bacterium]|nr:hypothetical protein [Thermoleophilia bacterium]
MPAASTLLALMATAAVSAAAAPPAGAVVDRVIRDPRITEASGLAPGLRTAGILWTHEDSGHPARLFAVRRDGRTAGVVRVPGVPATDWEALASYRDAGRPMLAIGDIGDNRATRTSVRIVVVAEPAPRTGTVRPARVLTLRYPTGPVDAEALLVDPDGGRAFVVTKGLGGALFQVPPAVWRGTAARASGRLVRIATVPLPLVTDGVMGPGGHPVLRTYFGLAVLPRLAGRVRGGTLRPLATMPLPPQPQGEGLTLLDARTALINSEGLSQPVLRVRLSDDVRSALASPARTAAARRHR